jgi:hypothetical protein
MKIPSAVVLLCTVSAGSNLGVWELTSVNGHRAGSDVQSNYGEYSTTHANGRPPYQSAAQLKNADSSDSDSDDSSDEDVQLNAPDKFYEVHESKEGNAEIGRYERVTTGRFSADHDDIFMRSMIENYALEGKKCDEDDDGKDINCAPDGSFWMNESTTRAASGEVLKTHKGLSGDALKSYLDTYFGKAWAHFDVNKGGVVEVIKMPQFMRFIASDQSLQLGESG